MSGISENLSELIKSIAVKAIASQKPTSVLYGTVISIKPLQIKISDTLILTEEFIVVPKSFTDYSVNIEINCSTETAQTNTSHTHEINYSDNLSDTEVVNKNTSSESGSFDNSHNHNIKGTKTITFYNALKLKDKVILLQVQGGQEFVIMDKV